MLKRYLERPVQEGLTTKMAFIIPYAFQMIREEDVDFVQDNVRVMSACKFLSALV